MKKMVIRRDKEVADATLGAFSLFDENGGEILTGWTLEPAGPDEVKPNLDRRIPEGKYNAVWSYSPRFKKKLPLLSNELVSKDRRILIHTGNYGRDTTGCVIVGDGLGKNGVFNSIKKFKELVEYLKFEDFIVEIDNVSV
ncbi:DUF5675 family protein [Campylobacter corcagiensis]|uniref:DUF5675 domain-containing protein n=1 Tax=Campylobacter corcagiensis TaxID=1448857 RepID=A0A7M1LG20_9BACT|nr:DUF5675 family protein [Campylobacter corcagiensis]QKF64563.1 hypothetical protein CCORG_0702 [Campylobacter corcagiensis]QOQ87263.1 hypothetical protein IMC76_08660 [Campylobacter corcagiensis]